MEKQQDGQNMKREKKCADISKPREFRISDFLPIEAGVTGSWNPHENQRHPKVSSHTETGFQTLHRKLIIGPEITAYSTLIWLRSKHIQKLEEQEEDKPANFRPLDKFIGGDHDSNDTFDFCRNKASLLQ